MTLAQAADASKFGIFLYIGVFIVIIYFFILRPQAQKAKGQKNFQEKLQKGDKVVTIGGIHGKIVRVDASSVIMEVDSNTKLKVDKTALSVDSSNSNGSKPAPKEEKQE